MCLLGFLTTEALGGCLHETREVVRADVMDPRVLVEAVIDAEDVLPDLLQELVTVVGRSWHRRLIF